MRYLLVIASMVLAMLSPVAHADVSFDTLGVHVGSVHTNKNRNWNNSNPGLYGVWKVDGLSSWEDGRYVVGTYYNSIYKQSAYAGRVFEWPLGNYFSAGVIVGVITGYERPVLPMVIPNVALNLGEHWKARLSLAPKAAKDGAAAIHLSVEYQF